MNYELDRLYDSILERKSIPYLDLKPKMRIAIVNEQDANLNIMKIDASGLGRPNSDIEIEQVDDTYNLKSRLEIVKEHKPMSYIAVAKICPGQSSMTLSKGSWYLDKNLLKDTLNPELISWKGTDELREYLGILANYRRVHWVELNESTIIKRISSEEMRYLEEQLGWQEIEMAQRHSKSYSTLVRDKYPE